MVRLTLSYRGKEKHYSTCVFPVILPYMPFMMFNFKNREILESRKTQFFSDYLFNIHISQRNRVKVTIIDMYDNTQHQFCVDSCQIIKKNDASIVSFIMAVQMGLEPTISSVTGRHVKPLHHWTNKMEQMRGIEPPYQPWQGCVLPLNYICIRLAVQMGLEPTISSVTGRHVKPLHHWTNIHFLKWRRRRDLNSRASFPTYTLSRGTSSTT